MFLLFFLASLYSLGCKSDDDALDESTFSYLALGDSYTIGEGVPASSNFPTQLAGALMEEQGITLNPRLIIARTGWRTDDLQRGIELNSNLGPPYDLVTILIGVNDQFQGVDTSTFLVNLKAVFDKGESLSANGPSDMLVVSIPDWSATPFALGRDTTAIRKSIDEFNAIVRREALAREYQYTNVTSISREARLDRSLIATDGLHPSSKMYARWVEELLPQIKSLLDN